MIRRDHLVREPYNVEALALQPVVPRPIRFVRVKRAIRLDDQPMLKAEEVHNIRPDRRLPAEFQSPDLAPSQQFPKLGFVRGRRLPHPARAIPLIWIDLRYAWNNTGTRVRLQYARRRRGPSSGRFAATFSREGRRLVETVR